MSDLTPLLREMADSADATEMPLPHEIRSAGNRRRRRLTVATVTVAVLGTVAAVVVVGIMARNTASVDPAGRPDLGTSTRSSDWVGVIGLPPPGTPPTGGASAQLVAAAEFWMGTWVYADGRIINSDGSSEEFGGYVVRQLTPSGVEAIRSHLLDGLPRLTPLSDNGGRLIVRVGGRLMEDRNYGDCFSGGQSRYCPEVSQPEDWLPASAWEDPTFRPFVAHEYDVCLSHPGRLSPAEVLPTEAADILLASPESHQTDSTREETCRVVADEVARELADIMDAAGRAYVRGKSPGPVYQLPSDPGVLSFRPALPHTHDADYQW